jgi:hypothetical protein
MVLLEKSLAIVELRVAARLFLVEDILPTVYDAKYLFTVY